MVSPLKQSDFTSDTGTEYKTNLDNAIAVFLRMAGAFSPQAQDTPDMTVKVNTGHLFDGSTLTEVASQNTGTITAPSTNDRIDRIVIDRSTGVASVITGSEATSPSAPDIPDGTKPCAQVYLTPSHTEVANSDITDERIELLDDPPGQVVWPLTGYGGGYFDGTNDYLERVSDLDGNANSKKGTIVAYVSFDGSAGGVEYIFHLDDGGLVLFRDGTGKINIGAENAAGTTILSLITNDTYEVSDKIYCIMASWDMATPGSAQLYVNEATDFTESIFTDDTIDYTKTQLAVGADTSGGNKLQGNLFSLWFDPTNNIDFSVVNNRRLFRDAVGNAVYLGEQGELVTGSQPILFLGYDDLAIAGGESVRNRGSGGGFIVNGGTSAATVALKGQYIPTIAADVLPQQEGLRIFTGWVDDSLVDTSSPGSTNGLTAPEGFTVYRSSTGNYVLNHELGVASKEDAVCMINPGTQTVIGIGNFDDGNTSTNRIIVNLRNPETPAAVNDNWQFLIVARSRL